MTKTAREGSRLEKDINNKLKFLRITNLCTMSEVAEAVGISMSTMQRYEAENFDVTTIKSSTLQKFAQYYQVPLRYLTDHTDIALRKEDFLYNPDDKNPFFSEPPWPNQASKKSAQITGEDGAPASLEAMTDAMSITIDICKLSAENRSAVRAWIKALIQEQELMKKEKKVMARPGEYVERTFTFNGKRYHVYGKTEEEAIEARALKKAELEGLLKEQLPKSTYTVESWAKEWLETYKLPRDKNGNPIETDWYKDQRGLINNYIIPAMGSRLVSSIKQADIVSLVNSGSSMSQSHNHKLLVLLRQIFEAAVDNDIIFKSPTRNVKEGESKEKIPSRTITNLERDLTIRTANKDLSIGLFYLIMLYCGCRPQEVAALTKQDYDKKNKILHITKAVKSNGRIGSPKNATSKRDIPVPDVLCDILEKEIKGKSSSDLICTSQQGCILDKDKRKRQWKKFKRAMEIENGAQTWKRHVVNPVLPEDLKPYCYRHTYCTDLQDAGVPVTVACRLMGHSSIKTTNDIYTHHSEQSFNDAREKINKNLLDKIQKIYDY